MTARGVPASGRDRHVVVSAERGDLDVLSQVIADAFHPLAVSQWLIPDPQARREVFPGYFRIFAEHAMDTGTVLTTPDRTAVALWLPVGEEGPQPPEDYEKRLTAATGPWTGTFTELDTAFDQHHPMGLAHHHLPMLAVRPDHQGTGIGTALLDAHHRFLDAAGLPAYLEASGPDTRQVYLRHGYADHGSPIRLPDGLMMYPMLRHPQATSG
jgi:GNAT superfamily N-acetyltransferase